MTIFGTHVHAHADTQSELTKINSQLSYMSQAAPENNVYDLLGYNQPTVISTTFGLSDTKMDTYKQYRSLIREKSILEKKLVSEEIISLNHQSVQIAEDIKAQRAKAAADKAASDKAAAEKAIADKAAADKAASDKAAADKAEADKAANDTQVTDSTAPSTTTSDDVPVSTNDDGIAFDGSGLLVETDSDAAQHVINLELGIPGHSNGAGYHISTGLDAAIDKLTTAEAIYAIHRMEGAGFGQTGSGWAGVDSPASHRTFVEQQINRQFGGSVHKLLKAWGTYSYGGY